MPLLTSIARFIPGTEARASFKQGAVANPAAQSLEDSWMHSMMFGAESDSGISVNRKSAMGVSVVYACVDLLARAMASLPVHVYRIGADGSRDIDRTHYLYDLLHSAPNEEMTSSDFRRAMQANLSLRSDAYAQIVRNRDGVVLELLPLAVDDVEPVRGRDGRLYYNIRGEQFLPSEVLHLKGTNFNGICAPDMLHTVRNVIGLAVALDKNAASFFKNSSQPGGFLSHPGKLSAEAQAQLERSFAQATSGGNAHRLKVLQEGLQYMAARTGNRDSQFDESRDRQGREVARLYGIPGHKVGIVDSMPRANVEQENLSFVIDTLRPLCVTWEQSLNQKLLTPGERRTHYIEFNLSGLLRGDLKSRYEAYGIGRDKGFLSVNEIRRLESMNPIGAEGDTYLQPLNMAPLGTTLPALDAPIFSDDV
jgi:HK97 family phage portal protein